MHCRECRNTVKDGNKYIAECERYGRCTYGGCTWELPEEQLAKYKDSNRENLKNMSNRAFAAWLSQIHRYNCKECIFITDEERMRVYPTRICVDCIYDWLEKKVDNIK